MDSKNTTPIAERAYRRRLRALRVLLFGGIALLALRALLPTAGMALVDHSLRARGLGCTYDTLDLGLLRGQLDLWHLSVRPITAKGEPVAEELLHLEHASVDLSMRDLLRGRISVRRIGLEGVDLRLDLSAAGLAALQAYARGEPAPDAPLALPSESEPPAAVDLSLPFELTTLRLEHARLHLQDATVKPALDALVDANLLVSNLGSRHVPARADFTLTSPSLLDVLRISAEGTSQANELDAQLHVELQALRPAAFAEQLRRIGLVPLAQQHSFEAHVELHARVQPQDPKAAQWSAKLHGLRGIEDLREWIALERFDVDAQTAAQGVLEVKDIQVQGLRLRAARSPEGLLRCAGFELTPQPVVAAAAGAPAAQSPAGPLPLFWIAQARAAGLSVRFEDSAVSPPAALALDVESATLSQCGNDPLRALEPANFEVQLGLPGIAQSLGLDGTLSLFAPTRNARFAIHAAGIEPSVLEGYLRPLGWSCDLRSGSAELQVSLSAGDNGDGILRGSAELAQLRVVDRGGPEGGERALLALDSMALQAFEFDPARPLLRVGELSMVGLESAAQRDVEGQLHLLGLERVPLPTEANPPLAQAPTAPVALGMPTLLPRLELDRLSCRGTRFTFRDNASGEPLDFVLHSPSFELTDLGLGGDAGFEPSTAQLSAQVSIDGLAGLLEMRGSLRTTPAPLALDLQLALRGEALDLRPLARYTQSLGVTPTLENGSFALEFAAGVRADGQAWLADATLSNVRWNEGEAGLVALDRLALAGLRVDAQGLDLGSIEIERPMLALSRDASGALHAAGLRVQPMPAQAKSPTPAADTAGAPILTLAGLHLQGARIDWRDAALVPPVTTELLADVQLGAASFGRAGPPLDFRASLASPGNFERLDVSGRVALPPNELAIDATLAGTGLHGGELARYAPENIKVLLRAGEATGRLSATIGPAQGGGQRLRCSLSDVTLREQAAEKELLRVGTFVLQAARIDPDAGVFLIEELSLAGFELDVQHTETGEIQLLGLSIAAGSEAAPAAPAATPAAVAQLQPALSPTERVMPLVRVDKLDLALARLSLAPVDPGTGAPLVLSARLHTEKPLLLCDRDLEQIPALEFVVDSALEPLMQALHAKVRLEPFAREPRIDVGFALDGIDATALARVAPRLASTLDASSMRQGVLTAQFGASLHLDRKDLAEFDFSRDFGAEISLDNVRLSTEPGSDPVAGLDALRIDVKRFSPASGDLHIREIEIERPIARLYKRPDGFHLLGLVLKLVDANAEAAKAPSDTATAVADAPAGPELRIDSLVMRGIDLVVRDESVEPHLWLPIDQMDVQVQRFTTRALREPIPLRFAGSLGSSATAMPARKGALGAPFEEMSIAGLLTLSPAPKGWIKLDVSDLDLRNFAGQAAAAGVELGDGYLDAGIRLRLPGDGTVSVASGFTFSELSLSEPEDGPISSWLHLPAPLDMVLFALKDANEEHEVPVNFRLTEGGVSTAALAGAAVQSVSVVIATAIASAPLRVLGTFTDLFGLTGGGDDPLAASAVTLEYAPGAIDLSVQQKASLAKAIGAMADDEVILVAQHALGSADVAFADKLANPDPQACLELVERSRFRRAQLQRERSELAADARVFYAVGRDEDALQASERLRAVSRELSSTEVALDGVLELLRPNAERRRGKRTRLASLQIAQARLDALHAFIAATTLERAGERVELRKPSFTPPAADAPPGRSRILVMPRLRKTSE